MDLMAANSLIIIEFSHNGTLLALHDIFTDSNRLDIRGLIQSGIEFVFAQTNSTLTINKLSSGYQVLIESCVDKVNSSLTCKCFDTFGWSMLDRSNFIQENISGREIESTKLAMDIFPQILEEGELLEDGSKIKGYTKREKGDEGDGVWEDILPCSLTELLMSRASRLTESETLVFKIPTYPMFEIQNIPNMTFTQHWLIKGKRS
jgi:hypothetical protein